MLPGHEPRCQRVCFLHSCVCYKITPKNTFNITKIEYILVLFASCFVKSTVHTVVSIGRFQEVQFYLGGIEHYVILLDVWATVAKYDDCYLNREGTVASLFICIGKVKLIYWIYLTWTMLGGMKLIPSVY